MVEKRICVVTGTRAEYGLLKPVIEKINSSKSLILQILVTGMHLLPDFGLTIKEIEKDGFKIDSRVPIEVGGDSKLSMSLSIGVGVISISQALEILDPDVVIVLGDRYEVLAAAIATSYTGKILAHICGGDSTKGGYDEYTRHAITKMAHLHFPITKKSARRIIQMGENPKNVHVVGLTSLDIILNKRLPDKDVLFEKYDLNEDEYLIVILQHPISTHPERSSSEMQIILEAITELEYQSLVVYPNIDPGGKRIIKIIDKFEEDFPHLIKAHKSLPYEDFLGLLKIADVLVGNSSSGILEAPSFRLPVVNIGPRQQGRERADNIIDVGLNKDEIKIAIEKSLSNEEFLDRVKNCNNPFGDGKTSEKIVNVLEQAEITPDLFNKRFFDQE